MELQHFKAAAALTQLHTYYKHCEKVYFLNVASGTGISIIMYPAQVPMAIQISSPILLMMILHATVSDTQHHFSVYHCLFYL